MRNFFEMNRINDAVLAVLHAERNAARRCAKARRVEGVVEPQSGTLIYLADGWPGSPRTLELLGERYAVSEPAEGFFVAEELPALLPGEYEGEVILKGGRRLPVRVDLGLAGG